MPSPLSSTCPSLPFSPTQQRQGQHPPSLIPLLSNPSSLSCQPFSSINHLPGWLSHCGSSPLSSVWSACWMPVMFVLLLFLLLCSTTIPHSVSVSCNSSSLNVLPRHALLPSLQLASAGSPFAVGPSLQQLHPYNTHILYTDTASDHYSYVPALSTQRLDPYRKTFHNPSVFIKHRHKSPPTNTAPLFISTQSCPTLLGLSVPSSSLPLHASPAPVGFIPSTPIRSFLCRPPPSTSINRTSFGVPSRSSSVWSSLGDNNAASATTSSDYSPRMMMVHAVEEKEDGFTGSADGLFEGFKCKTVFLFPGQGAQTVGMGVDSAEKYPVARKLFDRASEVLGYDLLSVCKEGPKTELDRTSVCQPAIFVSSMAAVERLKEEHGEDPAVKAALELVGRGGRVGNNESVSDKQSLSSKQDDDAKPPSVCCMGLSLGEYSALCFSGALDFEDGVRLTNERGTAMQRAAELHPTGMLSVIGLKSAVVEDLCKQVRDKTGESVELANYLCDGNYVISGSNTGIDAAETLAKDKTIKARMTVRLAVAGAFHTKFMEPAVERLSQVLEGITLKRPRMAVVSNVDGRAHSDSNVIKELLKKQVTSPVQWERSVREVLDRGMEVGYELGPGTVLAGIFKRMDRTKPIKAVQ
eukprot:GHVQ01020283.1.p1 GENE.GHVQ01020283.1~~GHVQ01020283.1.p1  ORF type:complete len:656 (-),score=137.43 GHVQ01020283.1:414-2327(-)